MYVYVCMCVCVYVRVCLCVCVSLAVCVCVCAGCIDEYLHRKVRRDPPDTGTSPAQGCIAAALGLHAKVFVDVGVGSVSGEHVPPCSTHTRKSTPTFMNILEHLNPKKWTHS
jgi:hypothetical protein